MLVNIQTNHKEKAMTTVLKCDPHYEAEKFDPGVRIVHLNLHADGESERAWAVGVDASGIPFVEVVGDPDAADTPPEAVVAEALMMAHEDVAPPIVWRRDRTACHEDGSRGDVYYEAAVGEFRAIVTTSDWLVGDKESDVIAQGQSRGTFKEGKRRAELAIRDFSARRAAARFARKSRAVPS